MRSESDIRHKLKQVRFRHRKKRVRKGLARHPENCLWNDENSSLVGCPKFCSHRERSGYLCDSRYGGDLVVAECPLFEAAHTAEEIKAEFDDFIETASKEDLAREVPDLMALIWTLGDNPEEFVEGEISEEVPDLVGIVENQAVPVKEECDLIVFRPWYIRALRYLFPEWVK